MMWTSVGIIIWCGGLAVGLLVGLLVNGADRRDLRCRLGNERQRSDALERMLDDARAKTDGWARTLCDACKAKQERVT